MRKIRDNRGFTLVEMMVCIVTLILIGLICSVGMNLASKSLSSITFDSESRMLESTLDTYISDLLRHATSVETELVDAESVVKKFTNKDYYIRDGILSVKPVSAEVTYGYLVCSDSSGTADLANKGVYAGDLYIDGFRLMYDDATGVFTGRYQIVSKNTTSVRNCTFSYRAIIP